MKRNGLSLIELIVTVVIVGILAALVFVALDPYRSVKVQTAAKKVATDLLYVRNLSLSTAKWYGVSFEANTYYVYETDGTTDAIIKNPSSMGRDFIVDIYNYYRGVSISNLNLGGGVRIEFDPLGIPYLDKNGSAFTAEAIVYLSYKGLSTEVHVVPNTGMIYTQ